MMPTYLSLSISITGGCYKSQCVLQVTVQDPLERRRRDFKVRTKWVANVNIGALLEFIQWALHPWLSP